MQCRILLAMACFVAVSAQPVVWAQEARVGSLGDPSRLSIHGVRSVPPAEVAKALFQDLDVAYASFPVAPLLELERLLVAKAVSGFKHNGFPMPQVTIVDRRHHLELTVEEGPRWVAGEIRVVGARAVDARKIIEGLLPDRTRRRRATSSASRWATGEPAHLDEPSRQRLSGRVEELLAQQGYIRAASAMHIEAHSNRGVATLVVTIQHEGEPARVRDIEFEGNNIHSRDQILAWLQLPADAVLSTALRDEIERRLRASGRFSNCMFHAAAHGKEPRLKIDECTFAPRLDQPLSREEETLLKLAAWVGDFQRRGEELLLRSGERDALIECVISPRRALVALLRVDSKPPDFDLAVVCSQQQISVASSAMKRKLVIDCLADAFFPRATFTLIEEKSGNAGFEFWWNGRPPDLEHDAAIGPRLTASAALSVVRKHRARCRWDGPILTAQWKNRRLRVDSRDGRLVELRVSGKSHLFSRKSRRRIDTLIAEPVVGQFPSRSKEVATATSNFASIADPRFFSRAVEFVCHELVEEEIIDDKAGNTLIAAVVGLSRRGAFRALDDTFFDQAHREPEPFPIVPTDATKDGSLRFRIGLQRLGFIGQSIPVAFADEVFARHSRPWNVWREAAFITNGKTQHMHDRLAVLFPEAQRGPLTDLALAEAMMLAGMKQEAADRARHGLEHLDIEAFRRDYGDFLVSGSRIPNYLLGIADAIRALSEAEVDAFFDFLFRVSRISSRQRPHILRFVKELRADANRPTPAALSAALDALWESRVEQAVSERFQGIIAAATPSNDQPQAGRRGLFFR